MIKYIHLRLHLQYCVSGFLVLSPTLEFAKRVKMAGTTGLKEKTQAENMQKIDLTTLTLPQLSQLKQQLEQVR